MKQILPQQAYDTLSRYVILDVRTPEEFAESHLVGATNIPVDDLVEKVFDLNQLPKNQEYLIYCRSGARSFGACQYLDPLGYKTTNLIGGLTAWTTKKLPLSS